MKITRPSKGAFRMRSEMRGGCGARVRSRKPLPGGFGHHVRRYYGRCAGCCRWTGTGARRVTPPRAASQETWPEVEKPRPRNLGQSRGGAPEGERADRKVRAASERCGSRKLRFSALRLPSFYLEAATFVAFVRKTRMQKRIARTRSLFFPPPRQRGRGTTGARKASEPWWRGRRPRRVVIVAGSPGARTRSVRE
jgi:hypothetical protein